MEAIYFGRIDEKRLAEVAPVLFEVAIDGDAVAREVVDRQADEVVSLAGTAIRRLRMQRWTSTWCSAAGSSATGITRSSIASAPGSARWHLPRRSGC